MSESQNAAASQGAPAAKPKRYSSQRQRATQQVPLQVHQAMVPQMSAMYPDQAAYYEQMGESVTLKRNAIEQYFRVVVVYCSTSNQVLPYPRGTGLVCILCSRPCVRKFVDCVLFCHVSVRP